MGPNKWFKTGGGPLTALCQVMLSGPMSYVRRLSTTGQQLTSTWWKKLWHFINVGTHGSRAHHSPAFGSETLLKNPQAYLTVERSWYSTFGFLTQDPPPKSSILLVFYNSTNHLKLYLSWMNAICLNLSLLDKNGVFLARSLILAWYQNWYIWNTFTALHNRHGSLMWWKSYK